MKNTTLQDYLDRNFVERSLKHPNISDFYERKQYVTWLLTDENPGEWFISGDYLWISFSKRYRYDAQNRIIILHADMDNHFITFGTEFSFPRDIEIEDEDKMETAALCIRKLMRKLAKQKDVKSALKFVEKYSMIFHDWTKKDLKEI